MIGYSPDYITINPPPFQVGRQNELPGFPAGLFDKCLLTAYNYVNDRRLPTNKEING